MEGLHLAARIHRRGRDQGQLERIAVEARYFRRHLRIDGEVPVAGIELHGGGGFVNRNILLNRAGRKHGVHGDVAARLNHDVFLHERPEPGLFDGDRVRTRIDEVEQVQAGVAGLVNNLYSGVDVAQCDRRAGDHRFSLIGDNPFNPATVILSEAECGEEKKQRKNRQRKSVRHGNPFSYLKEPRSFE